MRAVVQRVTQARVDVAGETVGEIGTGLMVLLGVTHDDTTDAADRLAAKIWNLRIMRDEKSAAELGAGTPRGQPVHALRRRPQGPPAHLDGRCPGPGRRARCTTTSATALRALGATVAQGVFGADMEISLTNDGPTTLILEL